mmetsp:Transcript_29052/g.63632  ORF Transcript_29052/g.63632 Transcript_29052/m.63632 type:complete len:303 (+) Transcript_29052:1298-2206(+)
MQRRAVAFASLSVDIDGLRHEAEKVLGQRVHLVLWRQARPISSPRLQGHNHLEHGGARRDLRGNVGVRVLAKGLWPVVLRQTHTDLAERGERPFLRHHVVGERGELLRGHVEGVVAEKLRHVDVHQPSVEIVRDAPAVVDLGDEILERIPWCLLVLVEVEPQAELRDLEVGVVEVVGDVPAEVSELAPIDEHRVEPAHGVEQLLVLGRLAACLELALGHVVHQPRHVGLETLWRLGRHLDAALQDADWELGMGRGREPEPEGRVGRARVQRLDELVELAQPRHHQVAVSKEDPVPFLDAIID